MTITRQSIVRLRTIAQKRIAEGAGKPAEAVLSFSNDVEKLLRDLSVCEFNYAIADMESDQLSQECNKQKIQLEWFAYKMKEYGICLEGKKRPQPLR